MFLYPIARDYVNASVFFFSPALVNVLSSFYKLNSDLLPSAAVDSVNFWH